MTKNNKIILMVIAAVVAGYFAIKWYENRQATQYGNTQGDAGLGTNLNSVAPELIGGSTGPSIGPALSSPITINVTSTQPPASANPIGELSPVIPGSMTPVNTTTASALTNANPENSGTGAQEDTPVPEDMSGAGVASAATGPTAQTPLSSPANRPTSTGIKAGIPAAQPAPSRPKTPAQAKPLRREGAPKGRPRTEHPQGRPKHRRRTVPPHR